MVAGIWMVKSSEVSEGSEEHSIKQWNKGHPYYQTAKKLAEMCSSSGVLCKVEFVNGETGYLAEEISKQSVEGMA